MSPDRFQPDPDYDPALFAEREGDGRELGYYVHLFLRHWWIVALGGLIGTGVSWWQQKDRETVRIYTAQAMVQRVVQGSDLQFLGISRGAASSDLTTELQILKTRAVLEPVVDSLGLRLVVPASVGPRARLLSQVKVAPHATARAYELRRVAEQVQLLAGGQEVARAGRGEPLAAPGLQLQVEDESLVSEKGLILRVVTPDQAFRSLAGSVEARLVSATNLIEIRFSSTDPVLAAEVANAVAGAYRWQAARRAREEAQRRVAFLTTRLAHVGDSLRAAQDAWIRYQLRTPGASSETSQGLSASLAQAEQDLRNLEARAADLRWLVANLETNDREQLRRVMVSASQLVAGLQSLYGQLQNYDSRRNELINLRSRTEQAPEVLLLDSLMAETRTEMSIIVEETLRLTNESIERAAGRVSELRAQVGSAPQRQIAQQQLERRANAIQGTHDMLASRLYEAQIAQAVETGDIQIVDSATVPTRPSSVRGRREGVLMAMAIGLFLGFATVLVMDRFDTRVRHPEDVRRTARAEIVGTIPPMAKADKRSRPLALLNGDASSEAFRTLRTNLRFARAEPVRVVAVTSAGPREGKSVIASNLALAFAQEGKRVLLVDADLRRPVLHSVFGRDRRPGLTDILTGEIKADIARFHAEGGVDVIPAGTSTPNPAELVGSAVFQMFLQKTQEVYDIVVVDTPPILAVTDASVIAPYVDGVLLVARQEQTHREALTRAREQLQRSRASLLGVVVNDVETGTRYGGYYGYGYHAYGYGTEEYLNNRDG